MNQPITGQGVIRQANQQGDSWTLELRVQLDDGRPGYDPSGEVEIDWQEFVDRGGSEQIEENRGA